MKMRKGIFSLLFCTFVFLSLPVLAQQSTLLERSTMALDYNHDLKSSGKEYRCQYGSREICTCRFETETFRAASFQYTGNPMELTLDIPSTRCRKPDGRNIQS